MSQTICYWKSDNCAEYSVWNTDCGQAFMFEVEGPEENNFEFCPYCGGRLGVKETPQE